MANELNDLSYNNLNISFSPDPNNIATSDELEASAIYQQKMGTNYSRGKNAVRAINFAGISLILTAAAIKTGSLISNVYVLNPPSLSNISYQLNEHVFVANFVVSNPGKYVINYYLSMNDNKEPVFEGDCSESREYLVSYDGLNQGDKCHFYVVFTNSVDYQKTIESYKFNVEE